MIGMLITDEIDEAVDVWVQGMLLEDWGKDS